jgi:hypothetical protein
MAIINNTPIPLIDKSINKSLDENGEHYSYIMLINIIKDLTVKTNKLENEVSYIKNNYVEKSQYEHLLNTNKMLLKQQQPCNIQKKIIEQLNCTESNCNPIINITAMVSSLKICDIPHNKYYTLDYLFDNNIGNTIKYVMQYNLNLYKHLYYDYDTVKSNINININADDNNADDNNADDNNADDNNADDDNNNNSICPLFYNKETNSIYIYNFNYELNKNVWVKITTCTITQIIEKIIEQIFTQLREWETYNRTIILKNSGMTTKYLSSISKITKFNVKKFIKNNTLSSIFEFNFNI